MGPMMSNSREVISLWNIKQEVTALSNRVWGTLRQESDVPFHASYHPIKLVKCVKIVLVLEYYARLYYTCTIV